MLLVAIDMVGFAQGFHRLVPIDEIAEVGPVGRFLAAQGGLFRSTQIPT